VGFDGSTSFPLPVPAAEDATSTRSRAADVLREVTRGGLAGLLGGILMGGVGGRVAMRLAALLSPDSVGRLTENGNPIGTISLAGSIGVVVFDGLLFGIVAGVVWVVVSPWLPRGERVRMCLTAALAVGLAGLFLVSAENDDFVVLSNNGPIVSVLLVLVALVGATVAWLDGRLDRRLPPSAGHPGATGAYVLVGLVGLALVPASVGFYVTTNGCGCSAPPVSTAVGLLVAGSATVAWWGMRLTTDRSRPPSIVTWVGRSGVVVAGAAGLVRVASEAVAILAA
jgi:hypothetical protein